MITAFLMGRKGSKGFPDKNLYPVLDHPLAFYPMKAAMDCPEIDNVYISTDDQRLIAIAEQNGLEIIKRPKELCSDTALGEHVYLHAYNFVKNLHLNKNIEIVVLLMCNAPNITSEMLSRGIRILKENSEYDSVVTVSKYNMWSPLRARRIGSDGFLHPFVNFEDFADTSNLNCDRDSQGDVWFADMGASIIRTRCLEHIEDGLLPQKWMGRKIYPLKQDAGLDVDYEWQIPQVEYWLEKHMSAKQ